MYLVVEVDKKELQFHVAGVTYTCEEALTLQNLGFEFISGI